MAKGNKFDDATKVRSTITASDQVERTRGMNRATINRAMNGEPPLSPDEAKKSNLRVNVNFGEMPRFAASARRQYSQAFLKPGNFFTVKIPSAPPEKKSSWELVVTNAINRRMKKSKRYFHIKQNQFASVVAHGIGPQLWDMREKWLPRFVAVEDIRVPTDTETSLDNLPHFAVRCYYTPMELADKARFDKLSSEKEKKADYKGWNREQIQKILEAYKEEINSPNTLNWTDNPEKMYELWKQNGGYFNSDAVQSIPLWHFYFLDDDETWKKRVVVAEGTRGSPDTGEFIYNSDDPVANDLSELLHVQFGDLNAKAPFLWHSVRSLGFLLLEPAFFSNLLQCRFLQHVFESMNPWLRSRDPVGRAKAQKVEFYDKCIVPDDITIVPQTERHQIPADLVAAAKAEMRQYMAESSSAYTQQTDNGTQREQTAFETRVKLEQANFMLGAILSIAFYQEKFAYQEICRRFCIRNSTDSDVRKFWQEVKRAGIPRQYLDPDLWDIEPEIPLGSGNATLQQAIAQQLMGVRQFASPSAQQKILHLYIEAVTGDPGLAQDLAPVEDRQDVTDAMETAELAFGTLMQGVPVRLRENHSPLETAETVLGLLAGKITSIEQNGNMATMPELIGLFNAANFIQQQIAVLALNPDEKEAVKGLSDALGKLVNSLRGFAQRLQEQQAQMGQGMSPETNGKIQEKLIMAETNARIKEEGSKQKLLHKEIAFTGDQRRKDSETIAQIGRDTALAASKPEPAEN